MTEPKACKYAFEQLGWGMGLRSTHYSHILETCPAVDFFEILSENYMETEGRPVRILERVAERYPIVMHGVSMNLGSTDPLDREYLRKLKALRTRCGARWVSDHLCWTGVARENVHDLLPLPYTEEALRHIVARIRMVQEEIEAPLVIENPSSYLEFRQTTMSEWEFLGRMAQEADCGLLLDVNNVYVSAFNHRFDAVEYLDALPHEHVVYFHLAGHTRYETHIIDTHSDHVVDEVWDLYAHAVSASGGRSTIVEWDERIPPFETVSAEVERARAVAKRVLGDGMASAVRS